MKYNDNGTYKDIFVKTFDTLPVGAEVDYDGETVPSGWEEVTDMSGSNANGSWIKFDDGTMICYILKENLDCSSLNTDGTFYYKTFIDVLFPQTFISKPVVTASVNNRTAGRRLTLWALNYITTTQIGEITVSNYWKSTDAYVDLDIIAIGRWK